jgi:rhodanese-related sulfurtransferase
MNPSSSSERRLSPALAAVIVALFGLYAAEPCWAQNFPPSVTELVARTKAQVRTIDLATFKAAFDRKSVDLIIDVREPGEYAEGHVPGAINIPRGLIEFKIWSQVGFPDKLDLHKKLMLYCGSGARAALAAKSLQDLNFSDVTAVDIRFEDWKKAGYPLARE